MAGIPVPGSRRRSGPPAPGPSPAPGAGHPPSKRARGFPVAALDPEDPFGAHGDFTADDLEELDTLASQALSQYPATTKDVSSVHKVPRVDGMSKHKIPAGKGRESMPVKDNFELEVLQAQHRELRQKLKIMEEEVLIKNGEIKILRDTLHQTESILEEQRRSHLLLEQERTQALSDKEKEFSKKLQSLQSELQFKDAEMNELRTKLQSSERANKPAAPSTSHLSPRKSPSMILRPEACSPLFGKTSFPTKESFSANMSLLHPCQTEPGYKSLVGREENKTCNLGSESTKQEDAQKILTDSKMQRSDTQGTGILARPPWLQWYSAKAGSTVASSGELSGVLKTRAPGTPSESRGVVICDSGRRLCKMERAKSKCVPAPQASQWTLSLEGSILINLLLKQPLIPGTSLGLCHLLSSCSEVPTGTLLQPPGFGSTLAGMSGLRTLGLREGSFSLSALREAQNLAFTGLNLVARSESSCDQDPAEGGRRTFPLCQLPGAVHLLPLVQFFIGLHCQALQDGVAAWRGGALGASPARPTCRSAGVEASPEDSLCSLEGFSVASLSVLQHLVCHSGAVVSLLLSGVEAESVPGDRNERLLHRHGPGDVTSAPLGTADDQGQHPLWKMLLHLLAFSSTATGHLRASILSQSLKVLVKLAENAPSDLLPRFQCVFRVLPQCLSPETPIASALLTTELLSLLVDHEQLAPQLCSHSEGCLLLLLYMYITSRPDKVASERQWLQLEQEAVWLLAKLGMQSPSPVTGSDCQCNVEAVRALTVMLHRQWLSVRRAEGPPRTDEQKRTVRCLRDTLLLLHRLSQKDKLFSMHCVEVLHQYDQVMPGVSTLIRGLPDVTDCEEAALDDLCAAETDVDDLEMECA